LKKGQRLPVEVVSVSKTAKFIYVVVKHEKSLNQATLIFPAPPIEWKGRKCPLHPNWIVREGGFCGRYYVCKDRKDPKCLAIWG